MRLRFAGPVSMQGVIQDTFGSGSLAPYVKQDGTPRYPCGPVQAVTNDQMLTQGRRKPSQEVQSSWAKSKGASAAVVPSIVRTPVILPPQCP